MCPGGQRALQCYDASHKFSDLACTDDANGLSVQIEPEQAIECEIAFADPVIGAMHLSIQRQDQGD